MILFPSTACTVHKHGFSSGHPRDGPKTIAGEQPFSTNSLMNGLSGRVRII